MSFSIIELDFKVLRTIRSLPPFHGARWAAVFRYVCRAARLDMDSLVLGIRPWRHGVEAMQQGSYVGLRLLVPAQQNEQLLRLLQVLRENQPCEGEFVLGESLQLEHIFCGLSGRDITNKCADLALVNMEHIFALARTLSQKESWALRFDAPMRLPRLQNGNSSGHRYCDQGFFVDNPHALQRIVEKIRFLPWPAPSLEDWPYVLTTTLTWQDMRYNKERGITLGGVTGTLEFATPPPPSLALALAFGQFSGVGKNPRFGLGYYTICL